MTDLAPNPKQSAGDKKVPMQCIPPTALVALAIGLGDGARKYGAFNWRELPIEYMTYVGAVQRHIQAWIDGQDIDPESGNPHLFHAIASLSILIDAVACGNGIDNRPPPGAAAKLMERYTAKKL